MSHFVELRNAQNEHFQDAQIEIFNTSKKNYSCASVEGFDEGGISLYYIAH